MADNAMWLEALFGGVLVRFGPVKTCAGLAGWSPMGPQELRFESGRPSAGGTVFAFAIFLYPV